MNRKIKILMGIPSEKILIGGPITHLPYLVDYFKKNNQYIVHTFTYGSKFDGGSLNKRENKWKKIINTLRVFFLFVYQVITFRPDIIHINTSFNKYGLIRDIPFSLFSFLFRKKLLLKQHGSSYGLIHTKSKFEKFLIKLLFEGARRIGVLTDVEKDEFIKAFKCPHKIVVVKNIVLPIKSYSHNGFKYFKREPFKTYGLFVSRIIKGKGLDDLIRSLPLILKTNPNFTLVVAGDGPEKISCKDLASKLNVNDSIIWLGIVPNNNIPGVYFNSDFFIFPSHFPEGMPMSLVEALRSGIPIITSRVRFAVNYLEENKNCLFINSGDIHDITDNIKQLLVNKDLQMKMKVANPKIVKKFSQDIVGKEFEILYKQMLNE